MDSMKSLHESEIVISFFEILQLMIKSPQSKRLINWHIRFFNNTVKTIAPGTPLYDAASRMVEELSLCQRRKRSRVWRYNASSIEEVYNHYWGNQSPVTLGAAWSLFETDRYRTVAYR